PRRHAAARVLRARISGPAPPSGPRRPTSERPRADTAPAMPTALETWITAAFQLGAAIQASSNRSALTDELPDEFAKTRTAAMPPKARKGPFYRGLRWWSRGGSNSRPSHCEVEAARGCSPRWIGHANSL